MERKQKPITKETPPKTTNKISNKINLIYLNYSPYMGLTLTSAC
jgi:hypothetical protein